MILESTLLLACVPLSRAIIIQLWIDSFNTYYFSIYNICSWYCALSCLIDLSALTIRVLIMSFISLICYIWRLTDELGTLLHYLHYLLSKSNLKMEGFILVQLEGTVHQGREENLDKWTIFLASLYLQPVCTVRWMLVQNFLLNFYSF